MTKEKKKNLFNIEGSTWRPWECALKADRAGVLSPLLRQPLGGGATLVSYHCCVAQVRSKGEILEIEQRVKDGAKSDEALQRTDLRNGWHLPHTPSSSQLSSLTIQLQQVGSWNDPITKSSLDLMTVLVPNTLLFLKKNSIEEKKKRTKQSPANLCLYGTL